MNEPDHTREPEVLKKLYDCWITVVRRKHLT